MQAHPSSPALPALFVAVMVLLGWWLLPGRPDDPDLGGPWTPEAADPGPEAPAGARPPPIWSVDLDGAATATRPRVARMSLVPVNAREQTVEVRYDLDAVTRPLAVEALREAPDWVVGVRLLLGEVGPWRLRVSRWSLLEGVGVLETVRNRFDPDLSNPLRQRGVQAWPGCGEGATFGSCVDPQQYVGLTSDRALRPNEAVPVEDELLAALDRAVLAWFVFEESLLGEITAGATSFVHLCGGEGYGRATGDCDGPKDDPNRGPIVFRGPAAWLPKEGRYALEALAMVDYEEGRPPEVEKAYVTYLLGADASVYGRAATRP